MNVFESSRCLHISCMYVIMYKSLCTSLLSVQCKYWFELCKRNIHLSKKYKTKNMRLQHTTPSLQTDTDMFFPSSPDGQALASMSPQPPPPRSAEDMEREKAMQQHAPGSHYNLFIYGQPCSQCVEWCVMDDWCILTHNLIFCFGVSFPVFFMGLLGVLILC